MVTGAGVGGWEDAGQRTHTSRDQMSMFWGIVYVIAAKRVDLSCSQCQDEKVIV